MKPHECPAFGTRCTPEHPLGATMVSSEGACAAYYRYRGGFSLTPIPDGELTQWPVTSRQALACPDSDRAVSARCCWRTAAAAG